MQMPFAALGPRMPGWGVDVLDALDAEAVRRWSNAAVARLSVHRAEIDALNVFPVADNDTGSNLLATMRAADARLGAAETAGDTAAGVVLAAMASGAAGGATGNSGFIASQLLRGLADAAVGSASLDSAAVVAGLAAGAALARTAVVEPLEGTVLSVADAAAEAAAQRHATGAGLADILRSATDAADAALLRTPEQLPELARHGVVDAGGRGLVVLLDTLARIVAGQSPARIVAGQSPDADPFEPAASPPISGAHGVSSERPGAEPNRAAADAIATGEFAYEVQYLLDASDAADVTDAAVADAAVADQLRPALSGIGDSVAVVPVADATWKVHVHADDIGAVIEAGVALGRVHGIEIVRFADQAGYRPAFDAAAGGRGGTAVVAVAPGAGLAHLFEAEGVVALDVAPDRPPSVDDVLDAIGEAVRDVRRAASAVVLLPNAALAATVAEEAARRARRDGLRVAVVPTRSPVQGLAAIAVHDAHRDVDDDVVAMAEAAAATRVAEISIAEEQALTAVGMCQSGDVLGLIDGEVVEIGRSVVAVAFGLVDRLLGVGAELMTIVVGDGAPRRAGELVEAHIRGRAPLTDVAVYAGGQPDHPVIIGAE